MAEEKKTFILYKSWITDVEKLTNKDAGILFINILDYVNGNKTNIPKNLDKLFNDMVLQIEYEWSKYNPKSGKYHWNYKGGITEENKLIRASTFYKYWRQDVFERDQYTCKKCKTIGGELNAHHIKPFATHPNLRTTLSNGITLCKKCHILTHKKMKHETN